MVLTRGAALRQPILAPDVELALIKAYKENRDEKALEAISRAYARLCYSIASNFTKDESRMEDLAQEGSLGIRRAIEKYDPEKGTRFSTYSRRWIQNYIALASASVLNDITVPARAYMDAKMGRMQPGRNDSAVFASMPFVMLDAPLGDENVSSRMDLYVMEEATPERILVDCDMQEAMQVMLGEAMETLSARERNVIIRRKLQEPPDTLEDISEDFGVTRERIRQIEGMAISKLRDALVAKGVCAEGLFGA